MKIFAKRSGAAYAVDHHFLLSLWERQKGLCALSGLKMDTKFHSMFATSPDRIDSSKGYLPGNIQLVCTALNFAKSNHTDEEVKVFIKALRA